MKLFLVTYCILVMGCGNGVFSFSESESDDSPQHEASIPNAAVDTIPPSSDLFVEIQDSLLFLKSDFDVEATDEVSQESIESTLEHLPYRDSAIPTLLHFLGSNDCLETKADEEISIAYDGTKATISGSFDISACDVSESDLTAFEINIYGEIDCLSSDFEAVDNLSLTDYLTKISLFCSSFTSFFQESTIETYSYTDSVSGHPAEAVLSYEMATGSDVDKTCYARKKSESQEEGGFVLESHSCNTYVIEKYIVNLFPSPDTEENAGSSLTKHAYSSPLRDTLIYSESEMYGIGKVTGTINGWSFEADLTEGSIQYDATDGSITIYQ